MDRKNVIQRIQQTAQYVLPEGARVILFGSQARGEGLAGSDWDILILINKRGRVTNADFEAYAYPLVDLGWDIDEEINPLLYTFEDWERRRVGTFYKNVLREGVEINVTFPRTRELLKKLSTLI